LQAESNEYLSIGTVFIKYGKRGAPKSKHVYLHNNHLFWRDPKDNRNPVEKKEKRKITISDIDMIEQGRGSKNF
jgi:hypothetical protein